MISAGGRFTRGLLVGLVLLGGVAILECAHTLSVLGDLLPGVANRVSFVVGALGPTLFCALLLGLALGLSLALLHAVARGLSGRAGTDGTRIRRIARIESVLIGLAILAGLVAIYPAFAPQVRRIANAAIMLSRPLLPFLSDVFIERQPPQWAIGVAGLVPAALAGGWWYLLARDDLGHGDAARRRSPLRTVLRLFAAVAVFGAGLAIYHVTATLYVNQYRDLHIAGLLGVGICFVAAVWLLPVRFRSPIERLFRSGRFRVALVLATAALLVGSHFVLERRLVVEASILWRTNAARKTVALLRSIGDRDGDGLSAVLGGDDLDDGHSETGAWWWPRAHDGAEAAGSRPGNRIDGQGAFTRAEPVDHVALVSVDALRTDIVGFLGASRSATPGLDRLAARGVRFRRAYAPGSLTHVTYPAILRARHPLGGGGAPITTFADALGEHGIFSAGIFCAFFQSRGGFTHSDLSIPHDAPTPSGRSSALVREVLERADPRSALWVHYIDPHAPYVDRSADRRGGDDYARYLSEVAAADAAAASLVDSIVEKRGPRTAVLIFSDHGEEFGEHGSRYHGITAYEELIHVPCVLIAPGLAPRDVDVPVSLVHVGATALDLLHVPRPASFHGRSLLRLAQSGADPELDSSILSVNNDDTVAYIEPLGRWKLIFEKRLEFVELYDLATDPRERANLADARPDVLQSMKEGFLRWSSRLMRAP
jgi:hypothetical protein